MKKMSFKSLNTLRYMMVTFIILAILLGLYRFSYIPERENYFTNRNFRMLSDMSRQITGIVESFKGQIDYNFVNNKHDKEKKKLDSVFIEQQVNIKEQVEKIRHLKYIDHEGPEKTRKILELQDTLIEYPLETDQNLYSAIKGQMLLKENGYVLQLEYLAKRAGSNLSNDQKFSVFLTAQASLSEIIRPLLKPDVFDNVLLIENSNDGAQKDRVIYEAEQQTFLATRLDTLAKSLKGTWSSYHERVNWGNAEYELYVQPVRIALPAHFSDPGTSSMDWLLVGLVDSGRFNSEVRAISRFQISQFAFAFFIFLFSIPFIKLRFIGQREELRARDLLQCVFSFSIITGLLTFWLLSFYSDRKDIDDLDEALPHLAANLENNLYGELNEIFEQADQFTFEMVKDTPYLRPLALSENQQVFGNRPIETLPYPFFRQFSWIDIDGVQTRKISTRKVITPLVNIGHRNYFRKIRDSLAWKLNNRSFFIQPLISITTGENVACIGLEPDGGALLSNELRSRMMELNLLSLSNVALPAGFGYCIIDQNGQVLFHSSPEKNVRENFFIECNDSPRLKAPVRSRVEKHLNVNYQGREHRIYTRPFGEIPDWTLVTFADLWRIRSAQLNALSGATILFVILVLWLPLFLLLVQMIFALFSKFDLSEIFTWFRPAEGNQVEYALYSTLLFAAAGLHIGLIFILRPQSNLWAALLFPSAATLFTFVLFRKAPEPDRKGWRKRLFEALNMDGKNTGPNRVLLPVILFGVVLFGVVFFFLKWPFLTYAMAGLFAGIILNQEAIAKAIGTARFPSYYARFALSGLAFFLMVSIVPPVALFKVSHDAEKKVLVRNGQLSLLQKLNAREIRIRGELKEYGLADNTRYELEKDRLNLRKNKDVYHRFFFNTQLSPEKDTGELAVRKSFLFLDVMPEPLNNRLREQDSTWADHLPLLTGEVQQARPFTSESIFAWFRARTRIVDYPNWELHQDITADSSWQWKQWHTRSFSVVSLETAKDVPLMASYFAPFSGPPFWSWCLGLAVLFIFLFILLLYFNHQVFGINLLLPLSPPAGQAAIRAVRQNTLFIGLPNTGKSRAVSEVEDAKIIDLRTKSTPEELGDELSEDPKRPDRQMFIIDHFDQYWQDREWNRALLKFLEELIYRKRKVVILVTAIDPALPSSWPPAENPRPEKKEKSRDPSERTDQDQSERATEDTQYRDRWTKALSSFTKLYHEIRGAENLPDEEKTQGNEQNGNPSDRLVKTLREECRHTPFLQEVEKEIQAMYPNLEDHFVNEDALLDEVRLRSEAYYQSIWSLCSVDEKITLIHLARNKFAPYKDAPVVRLLMRKGLVNEKNYRLFNQSFAGFVQTAEPASVIKEWQNIQGRSWGSLRTALLTFILAILAFTFVTQREIFNTSIAWITTMGALIPAILRLLSMLGPRQGKGVEGGGEGV